ncbi:c-type cytochrome [Novosphingobium album (ex Liu et al. 2023)]|uniref:C-type cytochrome n=1 Tax=Novosphingobium album (ex Liu et al. 2023) TaxID=3031130 RepID=A0ABT5WML1_9SPHN|nr:c-type cytochrome [Novosphingobium album (ex Liu et al. 2023)]MDE8650936.1 c-type cytochrome [Novosphingobium album (ex Liu et al. 2023)]
MKPLALASAAAALALSILAATTASAVDPAAPDGSALFRQRCQTCHSLDPGKVTPLGPNLAGLVGRKAGATGFAYSPALKASGLIWTRAQLDRFLAQPAQVVPGTRMVVSLSDKAERAAVIDFLAQPRP